MNHTAHETTDLTNLVIVRDGCTLTSCSYELLVNRYPSCRVYSPKKEALL